MSRPVYLFAAWSEIEPRLRNPRRVALFTDFDGTLAPIRPRPGQVQLGARVRRVLAAIARSGALVGIISGRPLADLRRRVRLPGIWYVGAHGFFLRDPKNRSIHLMSPVDRRRMSRAYRTLASALGDVPGIWLEPKGATVAVHYRAARASNRRCARAVVERLVARQPGLELLLGKKIWEVMPDTGVDKWRAIQYILKRERRSARRTRLYLGDDTTDERVFEKMTGLTIAVGKRHQTTARFYLRSPAEVRKLLERLAERWK